MMCHICIKMTQDKFIRMRMSTYRSFRKFYPALRKESAALYFERLSKYLEKIQAEWDGLE